MDDKERTEKIGILAEAAHEMNLLYCRSIGDNSQRPWPAAGLEIHSSAIAGVENVLKGTTPEKSHESWLAFKKDAGWKYGPVKDETKKEHPCFKPYAELPPEQQKKDHLFIQVVEAMARALGFDMTAPALGDKFVEASEDKQKAPAVLDIDDESFITKGR